MSWYFLGGILGVLDGAVGAVQEPVGMLGDPGVVWRALEGDVEGQLHAVGVGGGDEAVEVGEGAEAGMDGLVAAFGRADGPGTALVVGAGGGAVVGALAEGAADGMDGRQVEDVEAHGGDLRQQELDIGEGAVAGSGRSSFAVGAVERGKSSYQLEKRARSRSTQRRSSFSATEAKLRSG